jgi:hypothetical protein
MSTRLGRLMGAALSSHPATARLGLSTSSTLRETCEQQLTAIGCRDVHLDHLHGGELFEHAARGQSGRQGVQAPLERDVQTMGEESDEDVRLDALFILVEDRVEREIALEVLEGFFVCRELQIVGPKLGGVVRGEIGARAGARPAACCDRADS